MTIRPIKNISISKPILEGAGVKLNRAFGFRNTKISDPFLLLDDFRNDNIGKYVKLYYKNYISWKFHKIYMLIGKVINVLTSRLTCLKLKVFL